MKGNRLLTFGILILLAGSLFAVSVSAAGDDSCPIGCQIIKFFKGFSNPSLTGAFLGGTGSAGDPYQISTCLELQQISGGLSSYILTQDIDCSDTINWNGGLGFTPISDFAGILDGNNKKITGFYINRPSTNYVGLFGNFAEGAEVFNVGLEDVSVVGKSYTGGLVGNNYRGKISDSYVTGSVVGDSYVGGLVGYNRGHSSDTFSRILNSYSTASVTGVYDVGGLVGYDSVAKITNSYATGAVAASYGVAGGLIGEMYWTTLTNSYTTGSVSGGIDLGGLTGKNDGGTITNSYFTDAANDNGLGGSLESGGASALYSSSHAVYTGSPAWDFVNVWNINEGVDYPYFIWQLAPSTCGDDIIDSPIEVCDGANLGGNTCESVMGAGWTGVLSCAGDCLSFDTSGCNPPLVCTDSDFDGYSIEGGACGLVDCNDNDNTIYPGADDFVCDGIDNDCDGVADNGYSNTVTGCGVGACATVGSLTCVGGVEVDTCVEGTPSAEVCDGVDNDCDGVIDDEFIETPTSCGVGACAAAGVNACVAGEVVDTCTAGTPSAETCNGVDDNCNGVVDDGFVGVPTSCGVGECSASGSTACVGGEVVDTCTAGTPSAEVCDGSDNNCNGAVDDGVDDVYSGTDVGVCQQGIQSCLGGSFVVIQTEISPTAEICDGADNDCNGVDDNGGVCTAVDYYCDGDLDGYVSATPSGNCEGFGCIPAECTGVQGNDCDDVNQNINPGAADAVCNGVDDNCDGTADESYVPTSTSCGVGECFASGATVCVGGIVTDDCTPGTPSVEICDGLDNNCNAAADDGIANIYSGTDVGTCQQGIQSCIGGVFTFIQTEIVPSVEVCNNLDDDCDGVVDDEFTPTPTVCGVGACAASGTTACVEGVITDTCVAGAPGAEICNNVDDDCNSLIDDGVEDITTGTNVGTCQQGIQSCIGGVFTETQTEIVPSQELEDGLDNDCDTEIDEDFADADADGATDAVEEVLTGSADGLNLAVTGITDVSAQTEVDGSITFAGTASFGSQTLVIAPQGATVPTGDLSITSEAVSANRQRITISGLSLPQGTTKSVIIKKQAKVCITDELNPVIIDTVKCNDQGYQREVKCDGAVRTFTDLPDGITRNYVCTVINNQFMRVDGVLYSDTFGTIYPPNTLANEGGEGKVGEVDRPVSILLHNLDSVGGLQFDLDYPGVLTYKGYQTTPATGGAEVAENVQGNTLRLSILNDLGIDETSILNLLFDISPSAAVGAYPMTFSNVVVGGEKAADLGYNFEDGSFYVAQACVDNDGDGYGVANAVDCTFSGVDCNDNNAGINPGAADNTCDGVDDNCNGALDDGYVGGATVCGKGACSAAGVTSCIGGQVFDSCTAGTPGTETCNGVDDNCDGVVDDGIDNIILGTDIGVCQLGIQSCLGGEFVVVQTEIAPSLETCNGADDDCDGEVDEGVKNTYYLDDDTDGYGSDLTTEACSLPSGYATNDADCDDSNENVNPGEVEVCDAVDNNCNSIVDEGFDYDSDGVSDCFDNCPSVANPGQENSDDDGIGDACDCETDGYCTAQDYCDGQGTSDADCCVDADEDGYAIQGGVCGLVDCNDADANVNPGMADVVCDGVDNNCDGSVDEGYVSDSSCFFPGACAAGNVASSCVGGVEIICTTGTASAELCDALSVDEDCDGAANEGCACYEGQTDDCGPATNVGACEFGVQTCDINGVWGSCINPIYPTTEVCNGVDDDCDGVVDEDVEDILTGSEVGACQPEIYSCIGGEFVLVQQQILPAVESCNNIDDNCNDAVDEGLTQSANEFGACVVNTETCIAGTYVSNNEYVPMAEICNLIDDDCDGEVDEGVETAYYLDSDSDGYGDSAIVEEACSLPVGYSENNLDCNDANAGVNPAASELCNGVDDDCNAVTADGSGELWINDQTTCGVGECSGNAGNLICEGGVPVDTCDPVAGAVVESCELETGYDGLDNNCDGQVDLNCGVYCDQDSDGYSPHLVCAFAGYPLGDCNDADAGINPGAFDVPCDAVDQDCSGGAFQGTDADGDGYEIEGGLCGNIDCDDGNNLMYPSVSESQACGGDAQCLGTQARVCLVDGTYSAWDICDFTPTNGVTCSDNNACTQADICSEGVCEASPVVCNDAGACSGTNLVWTGSCDPSIGCTMVAAPFEVCDGLDNDCDVLIDEDFPDLTSACTVGVGACEASGYMICSVAGSETVCGAEPGTPTAELCDAGFVDENCDGTSNEGCACYEGQTMQCGQTNVGVCEYGIQTCDINGVWGSCVGAVYPLTEVCDGVDNDCDGLIDEDIADIVTDIYGAGNVGVCQVEIQSCIDGQFFTTQEAFGPSTEICDGLDNNCNGFVDDADNDADGFNDCNGADKCVDVNAPVLASFQELKSNSYLPDEEIGFGCTCEEVLYCKPGANLGEFKFGCSPGTYKIWNNQNGWAPDCQTDGIITHEGEDKGLFENTDNSELIDGFDSDNDNDAVEDIVDQQMDDADLVEDIGHGKPDWWEKKHPGK